MSSQVIPADFTLSELLAFVEGESQQAVEGYYTTGEWAEHLGIHVTRMRQLIGVAQGKGLVNRVWVRRTRIDGRPCQVPAYAFKINDST